MKLVENWKSAWKWYSVRIMVVIAALPEIWGHFPQEFRDSLPPHTLAGLTTFLGISAIVARLVSQEKRNDQGSN